MKQDIRVLPISLISLLCLFTYCVAGQVDAVGLESLRSETVYVIKHDHYGRLVIGTDEGLYAYNGYELRSLIDKRVEVLDAVISTDNVILPDYYSGPMELTTTEAEHYGLDSANLRLSEYERNGYRYIPNCGDGTPFLLLKDNREVLEFNSSGEATEQYNCIAPLSYMRAVVLNLHGRRQFLLWGNNGSELILTDCRKSISRIIYTGPNLYFRHVRQMNDSSIALVRESEMDSLIYLRFDDDLNIVDHKIRGLQQQVLNLCLADSGVFVTYVKGGFRKYDRELNESPLFDASVIINYVHELRGNYYIGTRGRGVRLIENVSGQLPVEKLYDADGLRCITVDRNRILYLRTNRNKLFAGDGKSNLWAIDLKGHEDELEIGITDAYRFNSRFFIERFYVEDSERLPISFNVFSEVGTYKSQTFYNGYLWVCHHIGLTRISDGPEGLTDTLVLEDRIHHVEFIDDRRCLAVLRDGLYVVDLLTGRKNRLTRINQSVSTIRDLYMDRERALCYVASHNGLFRFPTAALKEECAWTSCAGDISAHQLLRIRTEKLKFRDGYLFARHGESITQIALPTGELVNYDQDRGLPSATLRDFEVFNDSIYLITADAAYRFPLQPSYHPPRNVAELAGVRTNLRHLDATSSYLFEPNENMIRFLLSNTLWKSSGHLTYQFRLPPLREQWTSLEHSELTFYDLKPGKYPLEIRLIDTPDSHPVSEAILISFEVRPHLWQTLWFRSLITLLGLSAILSALYYRYHRRQLAQIRDLNHEKIVSDLKLRMIRAQINPHFIFNCLNSISLLNFRKQHEEVGYYIHLFARMIKTNLDISDTTFHSLNKEIEYLKNYLELERLRFKDQLNTSVVLEDGIGPETEIPCFFVQIFVENSIKHGRHSEEPLNITVNFAPGKNGSVEVIIKDDGKGFSETAVPGIGIGLRLIKDRIRIYRDKYHYHIALSQANNTDGSGTITHLIFDHDTQ